MYAKYAKPMRNVCEMYAKVLVTQCYGLVLGVWSVFKSYLICRFYVCEICETIFHIYGCVLGPLISFRIFAYKTDNGGELLFSMFGVF